MLPGAINLGGSAQAMDSAMDELVLCRRIAAGEQHLFARIIERYSGMVAGAIAGQGVAASEIEDLAQVTFINAYKGLAGFRGDSKLSSWLYRIAINVARGHQKRKAAKLAPSSIEEAGEKGYQVVDQASAGAQDSVVRNKSLAAAMAHLTADQQTVLLLYYIEELSYEEIAEALSKNINTVRTHIRRGKQRLAQILDAGLAR